MHRIRIEHTGEVAVVAAGGELDAFAEPELAATFAEVSADQRLLVDLHAVSFLDSTALGIVVRAVRGAGERGGEARIVLPDGSARRIFELTTLDRVLPVAADRAQALAALTPTA